MVHDLFARRRWLGVAALSMIAGAACASGHSEPEAPRGAPPTVDAGSPAPSDAAAASEIAVPDAAAETAASRADAASPSAPTFTCHEHFMVEAALYMIHRVVPAAHSASEQAAAERHHVAEAAFEKATDAFKAGRYSAAAKGFMEAASTLRRAEGQAFGDMFDADRRFAYDNAYVAWQMARAPADARRQLEAALAAAPADAPILKPMIDGVPAACASSTR